MSLLSKAKKLEERVHKVCDHFEIYLVNKYGQNLEVRRGQRDVFETKNSFGYGIRLQKGDAISFAYGSDLNDTAVDSIVKASLDTLPFLSKDQKFTFTPKQEMPTCLNILDRKFNEITYSEKYDLLCEMETYALNLNKKIEDVKHASLEDEYESTAIINDLGVSLELERSAYSLSAGVQASAKNDAELAYDTDSRVNFSDLDYKIVANAAATDACERLGGKVTEKYCGPMILRYDVVAEILDELAPSFFSENVHKKTSFLVGKIGEKVYSDAITIFDDGLYTGGMATSPFDDEGTPKQKTLLVENGMIKGLLYDRYWASRMGEVSTGNACREDVTERPALSYNNFYIQPGEQSLSALTKMMKTGIVITEMIGMHTAESISGAFSVGVQGYEVKDGKRKQPISHMVLTHNIHKLFSQVVAVGDDMRFYGSIGSPSVLFEHCELAGEN